jgi:hypothetical protein
MEGKCYSETQVFMFSYLLLTAHKNVVTEVLSKYRSSELNHLISCFAELYINYTNEILMFITCFPYGNTGICHHAHMCYTIELLSTWYCFAAGPNVVAPPPLPGFFCAFYETNTN